MTQKLKIDFDEMETTLQQSNGLKWTVNLHYMLYVRRCDSNAIQGITELSVKQLRLKQLLSAKDGKYQWLAKSDTKRSQDTQREYEKLQAVQEIIKKLEADFPSLEATLQPALTSVNTRIIKPSASR